MSPKFVAFLEKLADLQTELKPHQQRVVVRVQRPDQPGLVVAHGLGSGKTLTSIAVQEALGTPSDVVVPASLGSNYHKEISKHIVGDTPERDVLSMQNAVAKSLVPKNALLIVDEAHRARDPDSKTYKTLAKNEAEKVLLLTGSPFYNHPSDIAPLINLASGEPTMPMRKSDFSQRYISTKKVSPGVFASLRGIKAGEIETMNLAKKKELQGIFKKWVDYHKGSEEEFPTVNREDVYVPMTKDQLDVYDSVLGEAPSWVRSKIKDRLPPSKQEAKQLNVFLSAARQISNTTKPFQEAKDIIHQSPKIDIAFQKLQEQLNANERSKAVVYSNYLQAGIEPYKAKLLEAGIPFGEFTGDMSKSVRDDLVKKYNENELKVLLLSSAGGEGLDLKGTRLIQILEPHWNQEKLKQVEGRGIRYRSHTDLPLEEQNVLVQRFIATRPRQGPLQRMFFGKPGGSSDEYLAQLSANKENLVKQFRDLMEQQDVGIARPVVPLEKFTGTISPRALLKEAEYAPGLPVKGKITSLPEIKKPEFWEFSAHPHAAEQAGRHIDIRLGNPATGIAHSFVLPKAELPNPGQFKQVIPTSDHSIGYMDFSGDITEGYGKGRVIPGRRTVAEVYHSEPSDKPGTKLRFNLYEGAAPQEYSIRKDKEDRWFIHNKTQTRTGRTDLPSFKPSYKEHDISLLDIKDNKALMPKLDGAHTLIDLQAGRSPRAFSYRIAKKTDTGLIEHTHKIPQLLEVKVPKEFDKTILRAETVGIKDGKPIPAEQTGGLLNAKVLESRKKQEQDNVRLKVFPFSVERFKGKDVSGFSFEEKQKLLDKIVKAIPDLEKIPVAIHIQDKIRLLNEVKAGTHPLTTEGVVSVEPSRAPEQFIKSKITPDFDVYVREVHPAVSGITGKAHERAGSISYSWTPDGPVAGTLGGFKHDEAKDMLANPDKYTGRVAKVKAQKVFKDGNVLGALYQPRFVGWHLDKGEIEKLGSTPRKGNDMPFKSEAQRRFMYAKHPEIAKRWQKHTPKEKKLPEHVEKEAMMGGIGEEKTAKAMRDGLFDELLKISAFHTQDFSDAGDWIAEHPGVSAITGGATIGGGILAKRFGGGLLGRVAPSLRAAEEIAPGGTKAMKLLARKKGIGIKIPTLAETAEGAPTLGERARGFVLSGGTNPIYTTKGGVVLKDSVPKVKELATVGIRRRKGAESGAEITYGGMGTHSDDVKDFLDVAEPIMAAGKPGELSKEVGLASVFPRGADIKKLIGEHNIAAPGESLEEKGKYLRRVQDALRKEYGDRGFVVKPSDMSQSGSVKAFPTHEGDWGTTYLDYVSRLKPEMEKARAAHGRLKTTENVETMLAKRFRTDPAYSGIALEQVLNQPNKALSQEMLNIVKGKKGLPAEYRVHLVGGEVPTDLAYERHDTIRDLLKRIPVLKHLRKNELGTPEGAAEWVRKNVAPKMNPELAKGMHGLDVIRVKNPDGSYGYKLIELNTSVPKGGADAVSGFMNTQINPYVAADVHRYLTGVDAPLVSTAKATMGAGAGLGLGYGASQAIRNLKEQG